MQHTRERTEVHAEILRVNLMQREPLKDLGMNDKIVLKLIFKKQDWKVWTGFIWPRTGKVVGFTEHSSEPCGLHKMLGTS